MKISLNPEILLRDEGSFYIMAMCPVFADYFNEHGMVQPEEIQNFIYFKGKVNSFPRKNAKEPQWVFTVPALAINKSSFMLYSEHFNDCCFCCEDSNMENLIEYTRTDLEKLYKEANCSDEEEEPHQQSSSEAESEGIQDS